MLLQALTVPLKNDVDGVISWYRELIATHKIDVALFHVTLAVCIAFLPPWLVFIHPHFMHVPLILAASIVTIRLILRADCRQRFFATMRQFKFLIALLLAVYIALHSLNYVLELGQWAEPGLWRRQIPFLIFIFLYGYIFSSPDEPYRRCLINLFRLGTFFSVAIFISILVYNYTLLYLDSVFLNKFAHEVKGINRGLEILSICLLLLLATVGGRERKLVFVLISLTWVLSFTVVGVIQNRLNIVQIDSETVQFGLLISLGVYFLARVWPQFITHIVFGVIAAVLVTAPWLYQYLNALAPKLAIVKSYLILDRTAIWDAGARKALEHPWFGRGVESLRTYFDIEYDNYLSAIPPSPHNMVLQIWMDLGALGVAFALMFVYSAWSFMQQVSTFKRPSGLATITMIFIAVSVTRSMWTSWWMASVAFAVLLIYLILKSDDAVVKP